MGRFDEDWEIGANLSKQPVPATSDAAKKSSDAESEDEGTKSSSPIGVLIMLIILVFIGVMVSRYVVDRLNNVDISAPVGIPTQPISEASTKTKVPVLCPVTSDLESCQVGCLGAVGLKFGSVDASAPGQVAYFQACADFCLEAQEVV